MPSPNYMQLFGLGSGVPYGSSRQGPSYNPTTAPTNFSLSPLPNYGQGAYGMVPGQTGAPPSTFQQTTQQVPLFGDSSTIPLSHNILNELQGQLDPQAIKNMQDVAARYGVTSGMPGSNAIPGTLAYNANLRNIGLDTLAVKRQGQQDYLSALGGIGSQQLNPALLTQIAESNAQLAAAPDPQQAAQLQMQLYQNALNTARGPGGGTNRSLGGAGGTGNYSGLTPGLPAMGSTPYGSPTGSFNLSQSLFQPGDFEAMGFSDNQSPYGYGDWQSGMPSYESWGAPITGLDMFGDLGGGSDYSGYSGGYQPGDFEALFGG